jgi:hypothetical protein
MAQIDFDLQKYDGEFLAAGMDRLVKAAKTIRDDAKRRIKVGTITRVPGRKMMRMRDGRMVESTMPPKWMERTPGEMKKTIRVVQRYDFSGTFLKNLSSLEGISEAANVRVYAGNFNDWWATQMEFGYGAWKGGAQPFLRPALHGSQSKVRSIIEGG